MNFQKQGILYALTHVRSFSFDNYLIVLFDIFYKFFNSFLSRYVKLLKYCHLIMQKNNVFLRFQPIYFNISIFLELSIFLFCHFYQYFMLV